METDQTYALKGLMNIEKRMGYPTFKWNGSVYNFIPSPASFTRMLEKGGFQLERGLIGTVRIWDVDEYDNLMNIFNGTYPTSQQIITYSLDGLPYRIMEVNRDAINISFKITCVCIARGA